jgi:hypothetical protein
MYAGSERMVSAESNGGMALLFRRDPVKYEEKRRRWKTPVRTLARSIR